MLDDLNALQAILEEAANPSRYVLTQTPLQQKAAGLRAVLGAQGIETLRELLTAAQKQRTRTDAANEIRELNGEVKDWLACGIWPRVAAECAPTHRQDKVIAGRVAKKLNDAGFEISPRTVQRYASAKGLTSGKIRRNACTPE